MRAADAMQFLPEAGPIQPVDLRHLSAKDRKLLSTARDFESIMVEQVLERMRATVPKDPLDGNAEQMMQGMADQELARTMTKDRSVFGLANVLFEQLRVAADNSPHPPQDLIPASENGSRVPVFGASEGTGQ